MKKSFYEKYIKRAIDIFGSTIGILVLFPLMFIVAIVITIDSKGSAIFIQNRVGENYKVFKCYKFRSMLLSAPHDMATREIESNQYMTKIGKFIRKTSIDEIPQLFNIFKGDMSFIGYRPVIITEVLLNDKRAELGVLNHKPGISGYTQLRGRDEIVDMQMKAEMDAEYCSKISFLFDLKLFGKSLLAPFSRKGIVEGKQDSASAPVQSNKATLSKTLAYELKKDIASDTDENLGA